MTNPAEQPAAPAAAVDVEGPPHPIDAGETYTLATLARTLGLEERALRLKFRLSRGCFPRPHLVMGQQCWRGRDVLEYLQSRGAAWLWRTWRRARRLAAARQARERERPAAPAAMPEDPPAPAQPERPAREIGAGRPAGSAATFWSG